MKTKKYHVTDEDGSKYTIEEELDEVVEDEVVEEIEQSDDSSLTADEISALKRLAAAADKLLSKVEMSDEDPEEIEVEDEDEEIESEEKEEILDTDEEMEEIKSKTIDSKSSFGAINTRKAKDSTVEATSIEDAWQKRYGG